MAVEFFDRIWETTDTGGASGPFALGGAINDSWNSFITAGANGKTVRYAVWDTTQFEIRRGVVAQGTPDMVSRLAFAAALGDRSSTGAAIDWPETGVRNIASVAAAADFAAFLQAFRSVRSVDAGDSPVTIADPGDRGAIIEIDASAGPVDLPLPPVAALPVGWAVTFRPTDVTNAITVQPDGADTIDGLASLALDVAFRTVTLVPDGQDNWIIVAVGEQALPLPLAVNKGGTGAPSASGARANLGLVIGSDVNAHMATVGQAEAEAGTATTRRAWTAQRVAQAIAARAGLPRGQITGLTLSNNGTDSDHDLDVAAGAARDDDDTENLVLSSAITKRIDASWAVGTDQGGLDGSESSAGTPDADTWYHVHLIKRTDTGVVDVLLSESATSPSLPANYDKSRRIGAVLTDGSANIIAFSQLGDEFLWKAKQADLTATNPGTSAVLRTLSVPTGVQVRAIINIRLAFVSSGATAHLFTSPDENDEVPNLSAGAMETSNTNGEGRGRAPHRMIIRTNTSAQIRSRHTNSATLDTFSIGTVGWIDARGAGA